MEILKCIYKKTKASSVPWGRRHKMLLTPSVMIFPTCVFYFSAQIGHNRMFSLIFIICGKEETLL